MLYSSSLSMSTLLQIHNVHILNACAHNVSLYTIITDGPCQWVRSRLPTNAEHFTSIYNMYTYVLRCASMYKSCTSYWSHGAYAGNPALRANLKPAQLHPEGSDGAEYGNFLNGQNMSSRRSVCCKTLAVEHRLRNKLQKLHGCVRWEERSVLVCPYSLDSNGD